MANQRKERCPWERLCPFATVFTAAAGVSRGVRGSLPDEFWEHTRGAQRESLLAMRSILDRLLARVESRRPRRPQRIKVE
ncbi:MAG: hypothetical protein HYV08_00790 [Deltaproteobacteria bacterium]|nr:hypothetical protein [Deltaproteobacteria bacterium]MBI3078564.1 hypothetical protein [Deltaproteobacteria bacterium]